MRRSTCEDIRPSPGPSPGILKVTEGGGLARIQNQILRKRTQYLGGLGSPAVYGKTPNTGEERPGNWKK